MQTCQHMYTYCSQTKFFWLKEFRGDYCDLVAIRGRQNTYCSGFLDTVQQLAVHSLCYLDQLDTNETNMT